MHIGQLPDMPEPLLIGAGLYSLTEASRLTSIPVKRIRRWMEGYEYVDRGKRRHSDPIVQSSLGRWTGSLALSFADLIEVRVLDAFLEAGCSWQEIRSSVDAAREILNTTHPFSTKRFKTDGKKILADMGKGRNVLRLSTGQWEAGGLVRHALKGVEYEEDRPDEWWPMSKRKLVLLDPKRAFGAPIVSIGAVPTYVLAASAKAERSVMVTSRLFEVPVRAVRHAVEFETQFLAA